MSPWIRLPVIARIHSACHRLLAGGRLFHIFTPLAIGFLHVGSESLDLVIDPAIRCYGSSLAFHFLFKSMSPRGVACSIGLAWDVRLILLRFLSIFPRPVHARLTTHDDDHDGRCGLGGKEKPLTLSFQPCSIVSERVWAPQHCRAFAWPSSAS